MRITKLSITNFRNIESALLEPHPRLNFILGPNGAGKTSILECLVLLAKGRSFRSGSHRDLIGPQNKKLQLYCQLEKQGQLHKLGIERSVSRWRGRLNGEEMQQRAGLAHLLPHVLIEPNSHLLVDGGPDYRRRYLDWSVFHVKQSFLSTWLRFHRSLKQRNAALKQAVSSSQSITLDALDRQIAETGSQMNQLRTEIFSELVGLIKTSAAEVGNKSPAIQISFTKGWSGEAYLEYLSKNRQRDIDAGQTLGGPHRANIEISIGGEKAKDRFSRGQQKAFSTSMLLAQIEHLKAHGINPLVLLDDPASEFDEKALSRLLKKINQIDQQTWITSTNHDVADSLLAPDTKQEDYAVFHVKHGKVEKMV